MLRVTPSANIVDVLIQVALVDKERELDRLFATKAITRDRLAKSLKNIGALQARVRGAHLKTHLTQVEILTPEQNSRYGKLRG